MKKRIGLSLLLVTFVFLSLTACQSQSESEFELRSSTMQPSGDAMKVVIETAMSQDMIKSIDMSKYSSDDTALTVKLQDADGKDITVMEQGNQVKEDLSITSDGKTLNSFSVIITLKISKDQEKSIVANPASLLFSDIEIAGKKYKNFVLQLPDNAFSPKD